MQGEVCCAAIKSVEKRRRLQLERNFILEGKLLRLSVVLSTPDSLRKQLPFGVCQMRNGWGWGYKFGLHSQDMVHNSLFS
jgi:hypothetical protein